VAITISNTLCCGGVTSISTKRVKGLLASPVTDNNTVIVSIPLQIAFRSRQRGDPLLQRNGRLGQGLVCQRLRVGRANYRIVASATWVSS
jgi:hypothetical protein